MGQLLLANANQDIQRSMVFATGCEPDIDWSLCEEDTGFPAVLPAFFIVSAVIKAGTGMLYTFSMVQTMRSQLRTKKRMSFNTAMQMHVGIIIHSFAAFVHDVVRYQSRTRRKAHAMNAVVNNYLLSPGVNARGA